MKLPRTPLLWIALLLLTTVLIYWSVTLPPSARDRIDAIPTEGLSYKLEPLPWSEYERKTLKNAVGSKWKCRIGNEEVVLLVVDGAQNIHAIHDPAFCLRGAGFELASEADVPLPGGKAKQLELQNGDQRREVVYWFSNTRERYHSLLQFRLDTTFSRIYSNIDPPLMVLLYGEHRSPEQWAAIVDILPFMQTL